jgi:23S rRNA G2445 N2-methylase RlmL
LLSEVSANHIHFYCIDNSDNANKSLLENMQFFKEAMVKNDFAFEVPILSSSSENFFQVDIAKIISETGKSMGNIFMPLNPPYGIRFGKNLDSITLYKNIASQINETSNLIKKEKKHLLGFILCPNEETWSAFSRALTDAQNQTYHFTQGGIDIRVCQFFV